MIARQNGAKTLKITHLSPPLVQLMPGDDPQWTKTWADNVNQFNVKNASKLCCYK